MVRPLTAMLASAALILPTVGAAAASLPAAQSHTDSLAASAHQQMNDRESYGHRRGRGHHRRHRDNVDAGDILDGLLIIGTIAAIADAIDDNNNRYEEPYDDYEPYYEEPTTYEPPVSASSGGTFMADAINACSEAAARGNADRLSPSALSRVERVGDEWHVDGDIGDGAYQFSCRYGYGGLQSITINGVMTEY